MIIFFHYGIDSGIFLYNYTAPEMNAEIIPSGFLTAGQNNFFTCFVDIPHSLNATTIYVWTKGGTQVGKGPILNFSPLLLTNSGHYVCTVTVTSDLLSSPLNDESDVFEVTIKSK